MQAYIDFIWMIFKAIGVTMLLAFELGVLINIIIGRKK